MSNIAISGASTGTATFTIESPATSTNRTLTLPDETGTMMLTNTAVAKSQLPAGSVLQVLSSSLTSTQAITGSSAWTDITSLSVSITPTSSNSKFLIIASVHVDGTNNVWFRFMRDSTAIGIGDTAGSTSRVTFGNGFLGSYTGNANQVLSLSNSYLDSPATTSAITYKVQGYTDNGAGSGTAYINYSTDEDNVPAAGRSISSITVMEVAA